MKQKNGQISNEVHAQAYARSPQSVARHYSLSLFVSGSTPKSLRAIRNIRALCEERLHGSYDLRVIDIYQHPEQIKSERILVTPTLIKNRPLPLRTLTGDLSNKDRLLAWLGIIPFNDAPLAAK